MYIKEKLFMKKIFLTISLFSFFIGLYSQDTIMFTNKKMIVAKVIEVGINDITYLNLDSINGRKFIYNKTEINWIKFKNGKVDTIKSAQIPQLAYQNNTVKQTPIELTNDELKRLKYNGQPLGAGKLFALINMLPNNQKKSILLTEFKKMKRYRKIKNIVAIIGYTLGGEALMMGAMFSTFNDKGFSNACFGASALLFGTSIPIAHINKKKYINKRKEIAILYNKGL